MNHQEAKFILQCFRPDGADAHDADFAEALALAAEDRALGEWLAEERSSDAAFAQALHGVVIPDELRSDILAILSESDLGSELLTDETFNMPFQHGLSNIEPPASLRDEILAAMKASQPIKSQEVEEKVISLPASKSLHTRRFFQVAAIAATLVLGAFLAFQFTSSKSTKSQRIASYDAQQSVGSLLNASFELDEKSSDIVQVNNWLTSHELPAAEKLPEKLRKLKSLGCKKIDLKHGKHASLICFDCCKGGTVHLIVLNNEDVTDNALPTIDKVMDQDCYYCPKTDWSVARWQDAEHTYVLLARCPKNQARKTAALNYF